MKPLEISYSFLFKSNPQDMWQYLADTSKFNRHLGFNKRTTTEVNGQLHVTTKMMGLKQQWIEEPWTWVTGQGISSTRKYITGMAQSVRSDFTIKDQTIHVTFNWIPKNIFWRVFLLLTAPLMNKKFTDIFKKIDQHLQNSIEIEKKFIALKKENQNLTAQGLEKLNTAAKSLLQTGLPNQSVTGLMNFIQYGDDIDAFRIQVIPLAKSIGVTRQDLLRTCLHSTKLGVLNLSWDVICPHCRGVRKAVAHLGEIPSRHDCTVCNLDFETDKLESIEVTFHIHPSIRQVEEVLYCAAEPAKKTHIKVQQVLKPGGKFTCSPVLREGRHRLRILGTDNYFYMEINPKLPNSQFQWSGKENSRDSLAMGTQPLLTLINNGTTEATYILEELWWHSQSVKPRELLLMEEFRNLFSEEHLDPGVKLSLGQHTIMFTDIVDSTKFYLAQGDAAAFKAVKKHFIEIFEEIKKENGVIVKTIGDAVMAVFHSPLQAWKAAEQIQMKFQTSKDPIRVRLSIHSGQVMAVHLHQGIDFFGMAVNLAAKLQLCADAGEIAISSEMHYALQRDLAISSQWEIKRSDDAVIKNSGADEAFVLNLSTHPVTVKKAS